MENSRRSVALAIALVSLACGDEKPEQASPTATTPPAQASPTATFPSEIADAVEAYVGTTGLDGNTFSLTEPLECDAIAARVDAAASEQEADAIIQGTVGKLCIVSNPDEIGRSNALVTVGPYGAEETETWKFLLTREERGWVIFDVQSSTSTEE